MIGWIAWIKSRRGGQATLMKKAAEFPLQVPFPGRPIAVKTAMLAPGAGITLGQFIHALAVQLVKGLGH